MNAFLEKVKKKGDLLGLESVKNLFAELGNPQERLSAVQVVGTNGKGSVCCYLSQILREAGFRVGRFTSPQVFSYEERFVADGEPVTAEEMEAVLAEIEAAYHSLETKKMALPTIFEVEVATAVLFFLRRECDLVIMEAGMGGDLDATNVFSEPLLAVFTAIGLDHTQFLGETAEEIAGHKAGILKAGEWAVSSWQDEAVEKVLRESFASVGQKRAPGEDSLRKLPGQFMIADRKKLSMEQYEPLTFSYGKWKQMILGMQGDYQVENAVTALLAVEALQEQGYAISDEAVRQGLFAARWQGRMERLDTTRPVYLDGAHNPPAARALAETIRRQFAGQRITFLIGMLADKAYREVLSILLPAAYHVVAVTPPSERALEAKELAAAAKEWTDVPVAVAEDIPEAVRLTEEFADDVVVAAGSLTILAECKKVFLGGGQ